MGVVDSQAGDPDFLTIRELENQTIHISLLPIKCGKNLKDFIYLEVFFNT